MWFAKFDRSTNLGKLVFALGMEFYRLELLLDNVATEFDVNQTVQLIEEWEESVGIPDPCFGQGETLEERREFVLLKLTNYNGVQTEADFLRVINLFGRTAEIRLISPNAVFPQTFPIIFSPTVAAATHTMIVDFAGAREVFPLPFPLPFESVITGVVECLLRTLRPANVDLIFTYGNI